MSPYEDLEGYAELKGYLRSLGMEEEKLDGYMEDLMALIEMGLDKFEEEQRQELSSPATAQGAEA